LFDYLKAYIGVARLEYVPAEAPGLVVPLLLGATAFRDFVRLPVMEGVLVFAFLYISGFLINSLTDIEVDRKYKTHVSSSVDLIGRKGLFWLFVIHLSVGFALTVHIAYQFSNPWVLLLVICGIVIGVGYSIKPLHFKVRGLLHTVALAFSALFLPALFLYFCMAGWPDLPILMTLVGFALLHYGIALANQSGDFLGDGGAGLRTPAVRWGLKRTLAVGIIMNIVGMGAMVTGLLAKIYFIKTSIPYPFLLGMLLIPVVLAIGYYTPIKGMFDLYSIAKIPVEELGMKPEVRRSDLIKTRMNYPKWQASGIYSLLVVASLIFIASVLFA